MALFTIHIYTGPMVYFATSLHMHHSFISPNSPYLPGTVLIFQDLSPTILTSFLFMPRENALLATFAV